MKRSWGRIVPGLFQHGKEASVVAGEWARDSGVEGIERSGRVNKDKIL